MRAGHSGGGAPQSDQYYKHMFDGIYKIARDEGALALFSGSMARCLFHCPNVAIAMSTVEYLRPKIQRALDGSSSSENNLLSE